MRDLRHIRRDERQAWIRHGYQPDPSESLEDPDTFFRFPFPWEEPC